MVISIHYPSKGCKAKVGRACPSLAPDDSSSHFAGQKAGKASVRTGGSDFQPRRTTPYASPPPNRGRMPLPPPNCGRIPLPPADDGSRDRRNMALSWCVSLPTAQRWCACLSIQPLLRHMNAPHWCVSAQFSKRHIYCLSWAPKTPLLLPLLAVWEAGLPLRKPTR